MELKEKFALAIAASIHAGLEIMKVYGEKFEVEFKEDNSPLTIADQRANALIQKILTPTQLPFLSEEGREIPYEERRYWEHFWMVDPLDGTKEFVKRNGEFTVNIAMIHEHEPVFGVIYVPVTRALYFGGKDFGAYKVNDIVEAGSNYSNYLNLAIKLPLDIQKENYTVIGSRSHMSEETQAYFEKLKEKHGELSVFSAGSSLKLCLVAEGTADEYPRFAPTMEWDTAAGQAILEGSGKMLMDQKTNESMKYNKSNLLNNWFVAKSH